MLFDHFKPPIDDVRPWTSVHARLASQLSDNLNENLPPGYFASPEIRRRHEVAVV